MLTFFALLSCTVLTDVYHDANISDPHVLLASLQGGRTALMYASNNGRKATVKLLLKAGADMNAQDEVSTMWCGVGQTQGFASGSMTAVLCLCFAIVCLAVSILCYPR